MPNPHTDAPRGARAPVRARALGPYETTYDVRRGYDDPAAAPPAGTVARETLEPVLVGRRRDA